MALEREEAEAIAEKAGVTAATLVGTQIAKQMAKDEADEFHGSPLTSRGERILTTPVACYDFRGTRSYVLTKAWALMEAEKRPTLPVHEAWEQVRKVCYLTEAEIPEKKELMVKEAERLGVKVPVAVA